MNRRLKQTMQESLTSVLPIVAVVFLLGALLRILFQVKLRLLLLIFYGVVFLLVAFSQNTFVPAAFDSGGVTTGPMTVPFIMALGVGMVEVRSDKHSSEDSFGLVADPFWLCCWACFSDPKLSLYLTQYPT